MQEKKERKTDRDRQTTQQNKYLKTEKSSWV